MTTVKIQSQEMSRYFRKGDQVEVVTKGYDCFHPATVLRSPSVLKNTVFVEYLSSNGNVDGPDISEPRRFLRDHVEAAQLRPKLPCQLNFYFKVGDKVDAFHNNSWYAGIVMDILEHSKYLVLFETKEEELEVEQCHLRLHRKWVAGSWVPPLPQSPKEKSSTELDSRKVKINFKFDKAKFENGMTVEVTSDEMGYEGAWFTATIVDYLGNDKFVVEYCNLTTDDGSEYLREEAYSYHIRPCPPQFPVMFPFREQQEVDAWYNDAWWEGVISKVLSSSEYLVHFRPNSEVLRFDISKLRIHQDWVNGKWAFTSKVLQTELPKFLFKNFYQSPRHKYRNMWVVKMSNEMMQKSGNKKLKVKIVRNRPKTEFSKGLKVEVKSDEEGYQGSWFTAFIIESLENHKYLVEYETLKTDDETEQLREVAVASYIRPCPPDISHPLHFALHEKVDAWYNEGWWEGEISNVIDGGCTYQVYFETTNEYLEFDHCSLRTHQDWVNGKWELNRLVVLEHCSDCLA